ncbi:hypothetical protein IKX64_02370 [Candidatus Saccharibacteria bacterium]|nr:hypothetical protein [Candidatus Saccharibacteria bacterium]
MDQNPTPAAAPQAPAAEPVAPAPQPQTVAPVTGGNKQNKTALIAIIAFVAVAVVVGVVVAILMLNKPASNGGSDNGGNTNGGSSADTSISKCGDAFKCLEKIDEDATISSINELTGIEGKVSNYSDTVYVWEFSNGETIEFSTSYFRATIDYDTDLHKNSSINLDGYNSVKDQVRSGITVDALAEALGGKGLLYEKSNSGSGYLWVDADGGYLRASVSSKGNVTFVSGWF